MSIRILLISFVLMVSSVACSAGTTTPTDTPPLADDDSSLTDDDSPLTDDRSSLTDDGPLVIIDSAEVRDEDATVIVTGTGQALFEGNVVVELMAADGQMIAQQPTIAAADEVGGSGPWEVIIAADGLTTVGEGQVRAYATSAEDGSVVTEDSRPINFDFSNGDS